MTALSEEAALRAYAAMMNTLDVSKLKDLLADDFRYSSQWVFEEIESGRAYADYISEKLEAVRASGAKVWAEMATLENELPGPCVVMAQGDKSNLVAVVLAKVEGQKLKRLDMCGAPSPHSARRTGEYPV